MDEDGNLINLRKFYRIEFNDLTPLDILDYINGITEIKKEMEDKEDSTSKLDKLAESGIFAGREFNL